MQYLLLFLLFILFIMSYYFSGKDFFAPATVQVIVFAFAALMSIILVDELSIDYTFHLNTVLLITSSMALSVLIGAVIHDVFIRIKVRQPSQRSQRAVPISGPKSILPLVIIAVTIMLMVLQIYRVTGSRGELSDAMVTYNWLNSHTTELDARTPPLLRQLQHVVYALFIVYGFNLIKFFEILPKLKRVSNIVIIVLCALCELLMGARSAAINNIVACVVMFHLLRIQKMGKYKTYTLKFIVKIAIFGVVILWLFAASRALVGRSTSKGAFFHISFYIGSGILNLDTYLQNPIYNNDVFGKYTFFNLIANLRNFGADIPLYTVHQEYRTFQGISMGNVYTFLRIYYADFGIVGVYVLHALVTVIMSTFYEYAKKKRGNECILLFSMMYYTVVLSFFAERFFSNIISITFAENVVFVLLLYRMLFRKKVSDTLKVKVHGT